MIDLKKMPAEEVERIIRYTVATMSFEGLICTDEDKQVMRRILTGETTVDYEVELVVSRYQRK